MLQGTLANSPIRTIAGAVEVYSASTALLETLTHKGDLMSVELDRVGASKFFGFGVSQKATIKIRNSGITRNYTNGNKFRLLLDGLYITPYLTLTDIKKDEKSGQLTVIANDALQAASKRTVSEITLASYSIGEFLRACGAILGLDVAYPASAEFALEYPAGANFDGNENIRSVLDDIAEVTRTIYYISADNILTFKKLDVAGNPVLTVDKSQYFDLDNKGSKALAAICIANELGDNVTADSGASGETAYIRDNAFLEMREDKAELAQAAITDLQGLYLYQINCNWRGNYLVEIADKIAFTTKDNSIVNTYLLNDKLSYNGGLYQVTQWELAKTEETASNPATLGEMLKTTYAKVDKQKQQIDLVAQKTEQNAETIGSLQLNTDSISATVTAMEKTTVNAVDKINGEIAELNTRVNATVTADQVAISIEKRLNDGVSSVETATGFTFNDNGLTVSKSDSEISTIITENGMQVRKGADDALLIADKEGIKAEDLRATTFLIIGTNSRFEDYNNKTRTGCFWIGG